MRRFTVFAFALLLAGVVSWRIRAVRPSTGPASPQDAAMAESSLPTEDRETAPAEAIATAGGGSAPSANDGSGNDPDPDSTAADDFMTGGHTESAPLPVPLRRLLASQSPDGSWGDVEEDFEGARYSRNSATALAVLAFLSAGYCHLSKETLVVEGVVRCCGEAVKSGLKWLAANPADGTFDTALVSLAWGEAYAMTESKLFKELAGKSYARLWELQDEAGSWGREPCTSSWAALALRTADLSGLEIPGTVRARAAEWFARRIESDPSPQDAAAWVLLNQEGDGAARAQAAIEAYPPGWAQHDSGYWYRGTQALLKIGASGGMTSALWCEALEAAVDMYSADAVGRPGDDYGTAAVVSYSMAQVTREIYYRYRGMMRSAGR